MYLYTFQRKNQHVNLKMPINPRWGVPSPSPTKVPLPTHPPTQSTPRSNIFAQFAHLPTPPQTTAVQPTMPHRHNSQQTAANTTPTRHISENEEAKQSPKQEKNIFERFRHM